MRFMDARAADYLLKRFLKSRHKGSDLLPPGEARAIIPEDGVRSLVRLVEVDGQCRLVLRFYSRREAEDVLHRLAADQLVRQYDLAAPRVLQVDRARDGIVMLIEEYLAGVHPTLEGLGSKQVLALADAFAKLHGIGSEAHGSLVSPKRGPFCRAAWTTASNRMWSIWRWGPKGIGSLDCLRMIAWFRRYARRMDSITSFSLIHDKPNRGNLLWQPELRRFALLDLATCRYGCRARDLVQVFQEVLLSNPAQIGSFLDRYFQAFEAGAREQFELSLPFYQAHYHLDQVAINSRRLHKSTRRGHTDLAHANRCLRSWGELVRVVEANPV